MRIGLVSQEYPPETAHGGISTATHVKAHGLAARGHDVVVVSHSLDDGRHESMDGDVRVVRIPGSPPGVVTGTEAARWLLYSAQVAAEVATLHERAPFDVVDFPDWGGEGYVHLLNRTPWNHVPTVVHVHGPVAMFAEAFGWPEEGSDLLRVGREMEGTSLRTADLVVSSSAVAAEACVRSYGLDRGAIEILHLGVDTEAFRPLDIPRDPAPTIQFVGWVAENKGVEVLVRAWLQLATEIEGLVLRVAGRGEPALLERLRSEAAAAGRSDGLELVGFVERDRLPELLARADVLAAPSFFEGGPGLTALEGMACGLPVVACAGTGTAEVIEDGGTGMLVPTRDVNALTDALRRLLTQPELRRAMGNRARRAAVDRLDHRDRIERLEGLYAGVAQRRPQEVPSG